MANLWLGMHGLPEGNATKMLGGDSIPSIAEGINADARGLIG